MVNTESRLFPESTTYRKPEIIKVRIAVLHVVLKIMLLFKTCTDILRAFLKPKPEKTSLLLTLAIYSGICGVVEFSLATALFSSSNDVGELTSLLQTLNSVIFCVSDKHVAGFVETDTHGFLELGYTGSWLAVGGSNSSDS